MMAPTFNLGSYDLSAIVMAMFDHARGQVGLIAVTP
jgi:hypothetical protein